ncbi:MAG: sulfatase [Bryobacterales bacterium]|nr:sulfatase [Bryobacteraceae bacterium]MDW8129137.1 sulfatase [Bryobacterales bacterium]
MSLTRREAVAATALLARTARGAAPRPNILWLIAEDLSPDLGCYGNRSVHTPNLDRLAAEGVRFANAFVTGPVCSPSRSAIATGMYQTTIGAHNHRSHRDDGYRLPAGIEVFTRYLQRAGYYTANVVPAAPGVRGTAKTDFNFQAEHVFEGDDWKGRRPGQPFYAQVNFSETHRPFHRSPGRAVDPASVELPPYYPDHPAVRKDFAMYLETLQSLDEKVGRVLARLDEEGLADDTIVFFLSDHGRPMPRGKQFLYDEGIRIPLIVRVPEKFRPASLQPGTVCTELVSALDITASTLKMAGIEPPPHMHGRAFPWLGGSPRDHIVAARDRCDETVDRIRCVRTRRFKYLRNFFPERPYAQQNVYKDVNYPTLAVMRQLAEEGKLTGPSALLLADRRPPEELYDLENDPHEVRNLAADPAHRKTLERMRSLLEEWIRRTGDQGQFPENRVMPWDRDRTEVDGWCTQTACRAARREGRLVVRCSGKGARLERAFVAPGGPMSLEFRARGRGASVAGFSWSVLTDLRNPQNRRAVHFLSDGEWREYAVHFEATDDLAILSLEFGPEPGEIEFDWIRLKRASGQLLRSWEFA